MIDPQPNDYGGVNGENSLNSHPIFLNNPGILQTQEEMGHLPGSVALQEMKIKFHGRKLWFIPIQKTRKYYNNRVLRKFAKSHRYFSLLLIIQAALKENSSKCYSAPTSYLSL